MVASAGMSNVTAAGAGVERVVAVAPPARSCEVRVRRFC